MKKIKLILLILIIFNFFGIISQAEAEEYYVAPKDTATENITDEGITSWQNAQNINTPTSAKTAMVHAVAGDVVYFRGGVYELNDSLKTVHSGYNGSPIIIKNYPNENPELITNNVGEIFFIENQYWILDGLKLISNNMSDHDHGIISVGYDHDARHFIIRNSNLHVVSTQGRDNISAIRLQSGLSSYALIENNIIQGSDSNNELYLNAGIQYLGGNNVGTRILNNEIYNCSIGVFIKHANADTSSTEAEIAYNYFHDNYQSDFTQVGTADIYGNPVYINIHDNLLETINFGDNGGGNQGHHCIINHNTFLIMVLYFKILEREQ